MKMRQIKYTYENAPIPGGGYVTGIAYGKGVDHALYIRTDIGGTYRFDRTKQRWISLCESVSRDCLDETFPIAIAIDPANEEHFVSIGGVYKQDVDVSMQEGTLSISEDGGQSFIHKKVPFMVHGNLNGRGTGSRLVFDPADSTTLYFASQQSGLWRIGNQGTSFEHLDCGGEEHMTFVWCAPSGDTIIAGTAGVVTQDTDANTGCRMRGHSLYVSYDKGNHFAPLPMPQNKAVWGSKFSGYVAHRYDYDGTYFYVTLNHTGPNAYIIDPGYSCDCGDVAGGRVLRYAIDEQGHVTDYEDITPGVVNTLADAKGFRATGMPEAKLPDEELNYGFGGICSSPSMPGRIVVSTITRMVGDIIYLSDDYGKTWREILFDLQVGKISFRTSYMKPEYNGGHSLLHWISDVKIDPANPDELWFVSGTGVFRSRNLTAQTPCFEDWCDGIEETVHLNVYSPIAGPVELLDIVGDLGGFAFENVSAPCENSFADDRGNRYITCINADSSDLHPELVVVTARGNWTGKTKGGLIVSSDYGLHFDRLNLPYGITEYIDTRLAAIETPNVNAGWIALDASGTDLVYCIAEGIDLRKKAVVTSNNLGKDFVKTKFFLQDGTDCSLDDSHIKVFADKSMLHTFYAFGDNLALFVSRDGGLIFRQCELVFETDAIAPQDLVCGLIDCANLTEIRGESGKSGVFYAAFGKYGLWKIHFEGQTAVLKNLTPHQEIYRVGLGLLTPDSDYLKSDKMLYVHGIIDGRTGFYRSDDDGNTFVAISDEKQQFGQIQSIDGDSRTYGRFFIATGSFGLKWGQEA